MMNVENQSAMSLYIQVIQLHTKYTVSMGTIKISQLIYRVYNISYSIASYIAVHQSQFQLYSAHYTSSFSGAARKIVTTNCINCSY